MQPQPDLSKFSTRKLRRELERWERRRSASLAQFPELEDGSASLSDQYAGGPKWDEHAEAKSQITELKLELIRRDQAPNSRTLPPLPPRTEANPPATGANAAKKEPARSTAPKSWKQIEIAFLSDERVEICSGTTRETRNFGELGFEDRRSGKQNRAWVTLREIAGQNGAMPQPPAGKNRAMIQKRMEEIRKELRGYFKIEADPIPFNGNTYQASFKISRRPSFET